MIEQNANRIKEDLRQIADMLLLNGTLTKCPGLVDGKMGIAIFFFHYARYTQNMLFADYALDIIGELQGQIHAGYRADYEKGIAGIGVGIDYLIHGEFLDPDVDIFEDFDERMYRAAQYDPYPNFSLYEGLTGYGRYWISRLLLEPSSIQAQDCLMRITERIEKNIQAVTLEEWSDVYCFLHDLQTSSDLDISPELFELSQKQVLDISLIDSRLKGVVDLDKEKAPVSMGLLTGYAGEGLSRLTALNVIDLSWRRLLQ